MILLSLEPLGVLNTAGVQEVLPTIDGFAFADYDEMSEAVELIETANGTPNAVIYAPRTKAQINRLKDTTGQPLQAPPFWGELATLSTNQVPVNITQGASSNTSLAFVGDFSQMFVGVRQDLNLQFDRTGGEALERFQLRIRMTARWDVALARPSHFCVVKGIQQ